MDIDCNGYMAGSITFSSATAGNPDGGHSGGFFLYGR